MAGKFPNRLAELGIKLPRPAPPVATYVPYVLNDGVLYISGQLPFAPDGNIVTGILGERIGIERGAQAARYCATMLIDQINDAQGDRESGVQGESVSGGVDLGGGGILKNKHLP